MEKISLVDALDEDEKKSLFKIIDALSSKKKLNHYRLEVDRL
jgi:hypothetical protein